MCKSHNSDVPAYVHAVATVNVNSLMQWTVLLPTGVQILFLPLPMQQEAQLSPSDRAMRLVSSNLANCQATVQKLLIRQVLTKLMV